MNIKRIASCAAIALAASACTGGDDVALPDADTQPAITTTAAPIITTTTTVAPTTVAPTTTTTAAPAPASLAFASTKDIGRLFQVASATSAFNLPAGETETPLASGTLVQATSARSEDGQLWVRVRATSDDFTVLGWVPSDKLNPTTQTVEISNNERSGEFRGTARTLPDDRLDIVSTPGSNSVVGTLGERTIALHGGTLTLGADGKTWIDVVDISSRNRIGWVPSSDFLPVRSLQVKNDDGSDVDRRPDASIAYGAPLGEGVVVNGCNAVQVTFRSASSTSGTAIIFGEDVPIARERNGELEWAAPRGASIYAEPGEDVTFTLPSGTATTWYFGQLDSNLQAQPTLGGSGLPQFDSDGIVQATNLQSFVLDRGSCIEEIVADSVDGVEGGGIDPYVYSLPPAERDAEIARFEEANAAAIAAEEEAAAEEASAAEEEAAAEEAAAAEAAAEEEPPVEDPPAEDPPADE